MLRTTYYVVVLTLVLALVLVLVLVRTSKECVSGLDWGYLCYILIRKLGEKGGGVYQIWVP